MTRTKAEKKPPDEVINLVQLMIERVSATHGAPRVSFAGVPVTLNTDEGMCARMSSVWFIGTPARNHGFGVDWFGPARMRIRAWSHSGQITHIEMWVTEITGAHLVAVTQAIGLLND